MHDYDILWELFVFCFVLFWCRWCYSMKRHDLLRLVGRVFFAVDDAASEGKWKYKYRHCEYIHPHLSCTVINHLYKFLLTIMIVSLNSSCCFHIYTFLLCQNLQGREYEISDWNFVMVSTFRVFFVMERFLCFFFLLFCCQLWFFSHWSLLSQHSNFEELKI